MNNLQAMIFALQGHYDELIRDGGLQTDCLVIHREDKYRITKANIKRIKLNTRSGIFCELFQ